MSKNKSSIPQKPSNPHAAAAGAYAQNAQSHTPDPRELEARVLIKAAQAMRELQHNWDERQPTDLDDVLTYNRQIWLMFVDTAVEDKSPDRPQELRNNIANLGLFIFNHTLGILSDPKKEKLNILIEINQDIAAGLMTRPQPAAGKEAGQ